MLTDNALTSDGNEGLSIIGDIRSNPDYALNKHSVLTFVSARPPEDENFQRARHNGAEFVDNKPPENFWILLENMAGSILAGKGRPIPGLVSPKDLSVTPPIRAAVTKS